MPGLWLPPSNALFSGLAVIDRRVDHLQLRSQPRRAQSRRLLGGGGGASGQGGMAAGAAKNLLAIELAQIDAGGLNSPLDRHKPRRWPTDRLRR
jgi:hypothetical protein